jgi:hypothetical protein
MIGAPSQSPKPAWPAALYFVLIFGVSIFIIFLRSRNHALAWLPSVLSAAIKILGLIAVAMAIWVFWPPKSQ